MNHLRRDELSALGIHLPVLPTICPVPLPGNDWSSRLGRLGFDVISTGGRYDTPAAWQDASEQVPHRPVVGQAADVAGALALAAAGCRLVSGDVDVDSDDGLYRYGPDERAITFSEPDDAVAIARRVLATARDGEASALWVAAGSGFSDLHRDDLEDALRALTDGAVQARMWLAKEQFDRD